MCNIRSSRLPRPIERSTVNIDQQEVNAATQIAQVASCVLFTSSRTVLVPRRDQLDDRNECVVKPVDQTEDRGRFDFEDTSGLDERRMVSRGGGLRHSS